MESQETIELLRSLIRKIRQSTLTRLVSEGSGSGTADHDDEPSTVLVDQNRNCFTSEELLSRPNRKNREKQGKAAKEFRVSICCILTSVNLF